MSSGSDFPPRCDTDLIFPNQIRVTFVLHLVLDLVSKSRLRDVSEKLRWDSVWLFACVHSLIVTCRDRSRLRLRFQALGLRVKGYS